MEALASSNITIGYWLIITSKDSTSVAIGNEASPYDHLLD